MSDIYKEFKNTFSYYADYYRFLELNDEKVYNYIVDSVNKKVSNPSINDLVNMTIKVYYKQVKVRFLQDKKYLLGLFREHFIESDIVKSLENINLIIIKAKYELTFEDCLLILDNFPSIKNYIEQNDVNSNYLLKKLKEIVEVEKEEEEVGEDLDIDTSFATTDNITAYINETRNIPMLSWEEQLELANKMVEGDKKAREELIKSNLRLVISIAKKQVDRGVEFLDLIEAGNEGLLKAAERFDPKLGYRFTTYATWWIKQSVQRSIFNEGRIVRVPVHYAERINQFIKDLSKLELKLGRDPSFKEILANMDYSEEELKSFLVHTGMTASLNARVSEDDGNDELQEFIPDETNVENQVLDKEFFDGAIKIMQRILDDRALMVTILRTGLNGEEAKTLDEIGSSMSLTRERVRQIQKKAREKLQRNSAIRAYIYDKKVPEIVDVVKSKTNILYNIGGKGLQEIVSLLPLKDQELLKKRYGENFEGIINYDMTLDELSYIYRVIVPRVKQIMSESHLAKLEEAFGTYAKEVEEKYLNTKEKEIIKNHKLIAKSIEDKIIEGIINNLNGRSIYSFFSEYDPKRVDLVINLFFNNSNRLFDIFFNGKEVIKEQYLDKVVDKLIKIRKVLAKEVGLYDIFPNIRRIFVDKTIDSLNNHDKEILRLAFGDNYKDSLKVVVDVYDLKIVINKIKLLASKKIGNINIYYLFPEYSKSMIKETIKNKLSKEDYKVVVYYFGANLDEGVSSYIYDKNLRRILDIIYKLLNNKVITLKEYLGVDNISIEEYLTDEDRELLRMALGDNYYDNHVNNFLYPEEKVKFNNLIKRLRKQNRVISIINILGLTDEYYNVVYEILLRLNVENSKLLVSYLGKNPFTIKKEVIIPKNSKIEHILKKIKDDAIKLQPIVLENEDLAFYRYIGHDKGKILDGVEKLSEEETEIISSVFGYNFLESSVLNEYDYEKIVKLNIVKENLLTIISKLKPSKPRRSMGFYEYFNVSRKDRFYIEIVLDSLAPYRLEIIKKKYGDNFLDNDSYKNKVTNKEFDTLVLVKRTFKKKVEFLKEQKEENRNYFFDVFLKIDKDKYYNIVKANIEALDEDDKTFLINSFGKHYLDYPLEYRKSTEITKIMNLREKIIEGIVIENLFYNFLGISLEDKEYLEKVITTLTPLQRLSLEERFGKDFLNNPVINPVDNIVYFRTVEIKKKILSDMEKLKSNDLPKIINESKGLYEYLGLTKEDKPYVVLALKDLGEEYITLFKEEYGNNFTNNLNDIKVSNPELNIALDYLKDKVDTLKKDYKFESLNEYLGIKEEDRIYLPEALQTLSDMNVDVLKNVWGENYLTSRFRRYITREDTIAKHITRIKKRILDRIEELKKRDLNKDLIKVINVSYATSLDIKNNIEFNNWFNYLKKYLVVSDALILCLYLGFYNRQFTIQELAFLFGSNEKVMLLKLKEIIGKLKQYQDENIQKLLLDTYE